MKILRIALKNIASLAGTHTVDFTRGDLSRNNLFAISGPTGSGKSTLLDALCLALYEDTPRLASVKGAVQLADKGGDTVAQKDPANLLRRGTAEGFAEVAFRGVDGTDYTARWSVRRARNKADGALQNTEMVLFAGNIVAPAAGTKIGGDRKTEAKTAIVAKVGLSFDQFKRAVLLAQNDFAGFLKANDHERAEILQALTGTDRFEQISRAVFDKNRTHAATVAALDARLAGITPLDPVARAELDARLSAASAALSEIDTALADRRTHLAWHDRADALAASLADALGKKQLAETARAESAPRRATLALTEAAVRDLRTPAEAESAARTALADAEAKLPAAETELTRATESKVAAQSALDAAQLARTAAANAQADAKPDLDRARELDAQLGPLDQSFQKASADLAAATAAQADAQKQAADTRAKIEKHTRDLAELDTRLSPLDSLRPFLPDAAAWLDRIHRATTAQRTAATAETARTTAVKAHTAAQHAATAARVDENRLRQLAERSRTAEADARKAVADLEIALPPERRAELGTSLNKLQTLLTVITSRDGLTAELVAGEAEFTAQTKAQTVREAALESLAKAIPAAAFDAEKAHAALEAATAVGTAATRQLRDALKPGCPCAVCGSKTHPYADEPSVLDAIDAQLAALRQADKAAKKHHDDLVREQTERAADFRTAKAALTKSEKQLADLRSKLAGEETKLAGAQLPAARAILANAPDAQHLACTDEIARLDAELTQLAEEEKKLAAARTAASAARKAADTAQQAHATADKQLADLTAAVGVAGAHEHAAAADAAAKATDAAKTLADLDPLFQKVPAARADFNADAAAFAKKFKADTDALTAGETRRTALTESLKRDTQTLTHISETVTAATRRVTETTVAHAAAKTARDRVATARATLFAGRPVAAVETDLTRTLAEADERLRKTNAALADALAKLATADATRNHARTSRDNAARQLADTTEALDAALAAFATRHATPFGRPDLHAALARNADWFATEHAALRALDDAVTTLSGVISKHESDRDAHFAARPSPDDRPAIAADIATRETARTTAAAERDAAAAAQLADDSARTRAGAILLERDAARRVAAPWGKLNELIGSADGSKFRDIAQRHTLDILLGDANKQLGDFAGRYRLERVPKSLNLQIVDTEMGDERRSVHSLSGGESFLVSLALALGLASLTANRLRIESLFIDEGFGALDRDTLTTAMNALMHLEAQGRKIGVISHVTEMADAIPVQIRIKRTRAGASYLHCPGTPDAPPTDTATTTSPAASTAPAASNGATINLAARIEALLRAHPAKKFSAQALKSELALAPDEHAFDAARDHLVTTGIAEWSARSLRLA